MELIWMHNHVKHHGYRHKFNTIYERITKMNSNSSMKRASKMRKNAKVGVGGGKPLTIDPKLFVRPLVLIPKSLHSNHLNWNVLVLLFHLCGHFENAKKKSKMKNPHEMQNDWQSMAMCVCVYASKKLANLICIFDYNDAVCAFSHSTGEILSFFLGRWFISW